jgi:DNA polymerase
LCWIFETYFSDDYTLSRLSTESYCRDERFQAHGAAIKWSPSVDARWYDESQLRWVLAQEDWSDVFLVCHHFAFDGLILSHHYNVHPKMRGCTLSMARMLLGNHLSVSLDSVRKHYGLPPKVTPYNLFRGLHWSEMSADVRRQVAEGACDEVESIYKLFGTLSREFPLEELPVVDITMQMFTEPTLRADRPLLARVWEAEAKRKVELMTQLGVTEAELQSSDRFTVLLENEGVEVGYKDGKNGLIPAFAKTDPFMQDLLADEDDRVRTLAEARLGVKSTLNQTRAETFGWMASRGAMPVYLRYCGAHTTRWSGGDASNWQNITSGSDIDNAILPPEGFWLARPDSSQVECRLLNFVAGQHDKVEDFRQGRDPYVSVASEFYGYPVNKAEHPTERQVGKVLELQAGYGSGGEKIRHTLRVKAGILVSSEEGLRARDAYRSTHLAVVQLWKDAGRMIARLAGGEPLQWGPVLIKDQRLWLPNGAPINYQTLENVDGEWRLKTRNGWSKLYGAKLVENLIQALARVVISQAMLRISALGYRIVCMRHDDLWVLVPKDGRDEHHKHVILTEMRREPAWLPGVPLDAEWKVK